MYKDKEKQRQAVRESTRRWRERCVKGMVQGQGITPVSLNDGITQDGDTPTVIPESPTNFSQPGYRETPTNLEPVEQSHNPMMVGYVPPRTS